MGVVVKGQDQYPSLAPRRSVRALGRLKGCRGLKEDVRMGRIRARSAKPPIMMTGVTPANIDW